jgi:hypothetical protein
LPRLRKTPDERSSPLSEGPQQFVEAYRWTFAKTTLVIEGDRSGSNLTYVEAPDLATLA